MNKNKDRKAKARLRHLLPSFNQNEGRPFISTRAEKLTNQEDLNELRIPQLVVSLRYLYLSPITALCMLLQPFLVGRAFTHAATVDTTDHRQKNLSKAAPPTSDRGTTHPSKRNQSELRARPLALLSPHSSPCCHKPFRGERILSYTVNTVTKELSWHVSLLGTKRSKAMWATQGHLAQAPKPQDRGDTTSPDQSSHFKSATFIVLIHLTVRCTLRFLSM